MVVINSVATDLVSVVVNHLLTVVVALVVVIVILALKCIQPFAALAATLAKSPSAQPATSQFSATTASTEMIKAVADPLTELLAIALLAKASSKKAQPLSRLLRWKSSRN